MGQLFLDLFDDRSTEQRSSDPSQLRLLTWNVQHARLARAIEQYAFIKEQDPDVVVLTELPTSEAAAFFVDRFEASGYHVRFIQPPAGEYGVLVATRLDTLCDPESVGRFDHRACAVQCMKNDQKYLIVGLYVPSRGGVEGRNVRKVEFQSFAEGWLRERVASAAHHCVIVAGDLNVIEPDHEPHYGVFGEWEYGFYKSFLAAGLVDAYRVRRVGRMEHSWIGRSGDGYRFDHIFVSDTDASRIAECNYLHAARTQRLSDHSAMFLILTAP